MRSAYIPEEHLCQILARLNSRDAYLARLLLATGFRLDDVMHLRSWQLDREVIELRERKTGKIRRAPLPPDLRREVGKGRGAALAFAFPSLHADARKMHRTTFYRHFAEAARAAGYAGRGYSPHSLRKCYAVALLKASGSLQSVSADLGHSHIATTVLYAFSDVLDGAT